MSFIYRISPGQQETRVCEYIYKYIYIYIYNIYIYNIYIYIQYIYIYIIYIIYIVQNHAYYVCGLENSQSKKGNKKKLPHANLR